MAPKDEQDDLILAKALCERQSGLLWKSDRFGVSQTRQKVESIQTDVPSP